MIMCVLWQINNKIIIIDGKGVLATNGVHTIMRALLNVRVDRSPRENFLKDARIKSLFYL